MFLPADSSCIGRVSLHFTQTGLSMSMAAAVVVEKESEYMLAPTGLKELDRPPIGLSASKGGRGSGWFPGNL
jgi:hypothetical protein